MSSSGRAWVSMPGGRRRGGAWLVAVATVTTMGIGQAGVAAASSGGAVNAVAAPGSRVVADAGTAPGQEKKVAKYKDKKLKNDGRGKARVGIGTATTPFGALLYLGNAAALPVAYQSVANNC